MYNRFWNEETERIDLSELDCIRRFPFFVYQISRISKHLEKEEVNQALKIIRILIDGTCMYVLKKAYGVQPRGGYYHMICDKLREQGEERISTFLKNIYGSLSIAYEYGGVEADDVINLIFDFDSFLWIVINRYPDVLEELESGVKEYLK